MYPPGEQDISLIRYFRILQFPNISIGSVLSRVQERCMIGSDHRFGLNRVQERCMIGSDHRFGLNRYSAPGLLVTVKVLVSFVYS